MKEVKEAVGKLGNGKAVGVDNVCGELLKLGFSENSAILKCFHKIVVAVWQQEVVPQEWKDAIITVLFKKGDSYECGKFRGISLGAHAGKVVLKVVAMRLNAYCEWRKIFLEAQYGFQVGRSTDGMIYVVRGVQELAREKDLPLFMCFIDLQKAYDSVDRSLLWKVLARYGVPAKLISIIRQFHDGMRACVRLDSGRVVCRRAGPPSGLCDRPGLVQHLLRSGADGGVRPFLHREGGSGRFCARGCKR